MHAPSTQVTWEGGLSDVMRVKYPESDVCVLSKSFLRGVYVVGIAVLLFHFRVCASIQVVGP